MSTWAAFLKAEKEKDYFPELTKKVLEDGKTHRIFPKRGDLFNAMKHCSLGNTRVVILGQDPYIAEGQAHGLSFSVPCGADIPPSLQNVFKEINVDLNLPQPNHGCLISWAEQGVLLLNSYLTVRQGQSGSHRSFGWQHLTDAAISLLNDRETPCVFILWGNDAKKKKPLITNDRHLILEGAHPSPLSANKGGFFGGRYFSRCNDFLIDSKLSPINWKIESL
jgi:uracil-DNA glycosylase